MFEYKEIKKRIFYEGVELASFRVSYPYFESLQTISSFYEDMVRCAFDWFCEKYYQEIVKKYIDDINPNKRFGVPVYRYIAGFSVTYEDDDIVSIINEVKLYRGKNDILSRFDDAQNFDKQQQILLHPQFFVKKYSSLPVKKAIKLIEKNPICVKNGDLNCLSNGEWKSLSELTTIYN